MSSTESVNSCGSDSNATAAQLVGLLADADRRKVFAAIELGAETVVQIALKAKLNPTAAAKAIERLYRGGLIGVADDVGVRSWRVDEGALQRAARESSAPRTSTDEFTSQGFTDEQAAMVRAFMDPDGRLRSWPAARAKRLVILDIVAARFEPGRVYPERDVNMILGMVHADTAQMRRFLVDEEFLERRDGFYWRAGGTFDVGNAGDVG